MTFATRPLGLFQGPSLVTLHVVGSTLQWNPASGYGSAVPILNRNGANGIYCKGALCISLMYDAALDTSNFVVSFASCPGGTDPGSGFVTRLSINGVLSTPTGSNPLAGARRWDFAGDCGITAGAAKSVTFR